MLKKVFFIVSIITIAQISAMEEPMAVEEQQQKNVPCFFDALPVEICNYIVQFLTCDDSESQEEFIERTKMMTFKKLPDNCKQYVSSNEISDEFILSRGSDKSILVAYSPHETNVAILELLDRTTNLTLKLTYLGMEQKTHNKAIINKKYSHLALSNHADMFGTLRTERDTSGGCRSEVMRYKTILKIQAFATKQIQEFSIPGNFNIPNNITHPAIAFNKQGTQLIIHGFDHEQASIIDKMRPCIEKPVQHHIIFPVTINTRQAPLTLQNYFATKGICKQITQ